MLKPDLVRRESARSVGTVSTNLLSFPETVDDRAARLVAAGVIVQSLSFVVFREWWLLVPLAYGFVARTASGPRFSPLALVVTRAIVPRLGGAPRLVAGPPKRFAQAIGTTFSVSALVLAVAGADVVAVVVIVALVGAASLESLAGFCLGCAIFNHLIAWGVVPESVCRDCADITARLASR